MNFWYSFSKYMVRTYLWAFFEGWDVQGTEHIAPGPKIIIANHPNATDGFVLPFIFREKLHFLIQAELFHYPFLGRLLTWAEQIPVAIGRGREALQSAQSWLERGEPVVIFPEGRLNNDQGLLRAGSGAAILALETGAPVVPIGFYVPGEFTRMLRGRLFSRQMTGRWQLGGRCYVNIGEPWLPMVQQIDRQYHHLRSVTEQMMGRVAELTQQARSLAQSALPQSQIDYPTD